MSHRITLESDVVIARPMHIREPDAIDGSIHRRFDFNDSDITVWSCERVGFRVHKARLASASLFFQQMFDGTLGLKTHGEDAPQLAEPADTLAVLFAMCYPFDPHDAPFELFSESLDIALLISCYEASEKYGMWVARQVMEQRLMQFVQKDPFRLVRTGYVHRNQALLTAAAKATLQYNILGNTPKYRRKAGMTWASLVEYHLAYQRLVNSTLNSMSCTLYNRSSLKMESETRKYGCSPNVSPFPAEPCEAARSCQARWRDVRQALSARMNADWPEASLLSSIDAILCSNPKIYFCAGCTATWPEMRERATKLRPSLILKLDEIDRALSA